MTLEKYRIMHSALIELYQWIEFDLEGLYAFISGKPFAKGLDEIEKYAIGKVLREIREVENEQGLSVLSEADYQNIDALCDRRNYWCHECYTAARDKETNTPKNAAQLFPDYRSAEQILARIRQIKECWAKQYNSPT